MEYFILLYIISALFWPTVIIGAIIFFIRRKKPHSQSENMQVAFSREDDVSQWLLLLATFFLSVTLLSLNRDAGDILSWQSIILFSTALGFGVAYYFKAITVLLFSIFGVGAWWVSQTYAWVEGKDIQSTGIFTGFVFIILLLYSIGSIHERVFYHRRFGMVYGVLGIIAIIGVLFVVSSTSGLVMVEGMTDGLMITNSWQLTVSLVVLLLALAGALVYGVSKKVYHPGELVAVVGLAVLFGCLAVLSPQSIFSGEGYGAVSASLTSQGILWALLFNSVAFFMLLGVIFLGYTRKEAWLINMGTIFLFLFIIQKYFDWFFTFLDKSIFFIGAGILLFGVGWFMEKGRRIAVARIASKKNTADKKA